MPFRERVKKVLSRKGSGSSASGLQKRNTHQSVEAPVETFPKPKYRGPVDPAHKATLEAFSFGDSDRRNSQQSQYSPCGTKLSTRNNSLAKPNPRQFTTRGKSNIGHVMQNSDDSGDVANCEKLLVLQRLAIR